MIGQWKPGEKKTCKIVVIGRRIDTAFLKKAFKAAMEDELKVTYSACMGVEVKLKRDEPSECKQQY